MSDTEANRESYSTSQRWGGWGNLACAIAAVLILATVLNYLSHRHHTRADWAGTGARARTT